MIKNKAELIAKISEIRGRINMMNKAHQDKVDDLEEMIDRLEDFAYKNIPLPKSPKSD